jgi:amino acid transporter
MKNPRVTVPRAMVGSIIINAAMGFSLLIAILFCMGALQDALITQTGFPIIQIFHHITSGNKLATSALISTIVLSASGATVGLMASTSRTLWAFARDGAPPFSRWLSQVNPKHNIPTNSVVCVAVLLTLFGFLNIASTTAFNAILSLAVECLALSYLLPIAMLLHRRILYPQDLAHGPWKLPGRSGIAANILAILYNGYICIFLLFPPFQPVTAENMNYAGVVLGGVLLLATVRWFAGANKFYKGPSGLTV